MNFRNAVIALLFAAVTLTLAGCKSAEEVQRERLQADFDAARMFGPVPYWEDNNAIRDRMLALCDFLQVDVPDEHMGVTAFWCAGGGKRIEAARYAKIKRGESGGLVITASRKLEGEGTRIYHPFDLSDPVDLIALCCADMTQAEIAKGMAYALECEAKDLMNDVESAAGHLRRSTSVEDGVRLAASWGIKKLSPKAVEEYLKGDGLDKIFAPDPKPDTGSIEDQRTWLEGELNRLKGDFADHQKQRPSTAGHTLESYLAAMKVWREWVASYELEILELEDNLESLSDLETAQKKWEEDKKKLKAKKAIAAETLRAIAAKDEASAATSH